MSASLTIFGLAGGQHHTDDRHPVGARRGREIPASLPGQGVAGEYRIESGDRRIRRIKHGDADRDPATSAKAGMQRSYLLTMRRSAGEHHMRVMLGIGVVQAETVRPEYLAPRHVTTHPCTNQCPVNLVHAQHIARGCFTVQKT